MSLKTGGKIFEALDKEKYEVYNYDPKFDLEKLIEDIFKKKIDLVFPALHGPFGEDGKLQGMLDVLGVPYVFSGCLASALAMNKHKAKIVAFSSGVNISEDILLEREDEINYDEIIEKIGFPVVIKPIELGSSVGMAIVNNKEELISGIENAFSFGGKIILEKFVKGRELTVAVVEDGKARALPVIEIIPKKSKWFDYQAKYEAGATDEICPAKIPKEIEKKVQELAVKVFKTIGCEDLARADFIWDEKENRIYFLEINTIPGMTATSLAPQAAKADGMEFPVFLDKLIANNLK